MPSPQEVWFSHEKLEVYQNSIEFVAWSSLLLESSARVGDVRDQLDRASSSVPLNIAEGNGKYSAKDRCRFFDTAHGSALECAAALDILVAKRKLTASDIRPGKERLQHIVRMLIGLIKLNSEREYDRREVVQSPPTSLTTATACSDPNPNPAPNPNLPASSP